MNVLEYLKDNLLYQDGGMGTLLQERGLQPGELPERWNISHSDIVIDIHRAYYDAGSNIVSTNTFGANILKFDKDELKELIRAAVENVKKAQILSSGQQEKFVALDIGPIGKLLKPYGDYDFEDAVSVYAETVRIGVECGVDLIFIETMNDSYDTKAAVLAAKENSSLPVFVSNAYSEDGKLMTGAAPSAMVAMLEGLGVDAVGANCSLGPAQLRGVVEEYLRTASVPVLLKPNAGLPHTEDGKTVFDVMPEEFSDLMAEFVREGVRIAGGCCGTTPDHIRQTVNKTSDIVPVPVTDKKRTVISSYSHTVEFGGAPVLIGERINPTGKKKFKEALRAHDIEHILNVGLTQVDRGAQVLDVNVGIPEIDEPALLTEVVYELQAIIDLPLQIDTTDITAMERALRRYNGKAMINSVNGKDEVMDAIFPLVKKYGGLVVCLTLDEAGIPDNAEDRIRIAKKIIERAASYGIPCKDLIFDTLAMTVSADDKAAVATLDALSYIRHELGCNTSLGVSNVSFGLPQREIITSAFFLMAMTRGLSAAIMNPNSNEMMKVWYSFKTLMGIDTSCGEYIANIDKFAVSDLTAGTPASVPVADDGLTELQRAIVKGMKEQAAKLTSAMLADTAPLDIVSEQIIPALDIVGKGFEAKTMYLPQLLMSAEASQFAFEQIKKKMAESGSSGPTRGKFVIATVKGDIHDIGKNIVKLILENYGFDVIDLGRDVPPETVVEAVVREHAPLCGLSALMTTTVPAMEETIKLMRTDAPWCKVCVGGAVLTQEYADMIGADFYGKDAMATVRYAVSVVEGN
ncbi:5-methyltetrahydrofolate--homocysteine methyltransferase [Ruminococcaceae bacterium YRB3002]|nr:5-methyltetrahydrofolate--homocysteine methyltransferase [Ruminococcaceae bacterium YRB3002]